MDVNFSPEIRVIDANVNRVSEGLRVLDDVARFILNDQTLSRHFKDIRHKITGSTKKLGIRLLDARDVSSDWGSTSKENSSGRDLLSIVSVNASRAQEGLRVIEEMAKSRDLNFIDPAIFKNARFAVYDMERELISKLSRRQAATVIKGLYVIIDIDYIGRRDPLALTSKVIAGGARIVQLRYKCGDKKQIYDLATRLQKLCSSKKVLFLVNDHVDVAMAAGADGVHLGQSDLPVIEARKL